MERDFRLDLPLLASRMCSLSVAAAVRCGRRDVLESLILDVFGVASAAAAAAILLALRSFVGLMTALLRLLRLLLIARFPLEEALSFR